MSFSTTTPATIVRRSRRTSAAAATIVATTAAVGWLSTGIAAAGGPARSVSCVGDTLSGSLATTPGAVVRLLAGHDAAHLTDTGIHESAAGGSTSFTFDISGRSEKMFRVDAVGGAGRVVAQTRPVNANSCAPGSEVPEAPTPVLIPMTLLATAGATVLVARRRFRVVALATS